MGTRIKDCLSLLKSYREHSYVRLACAQLVNCNLNALLCFSSEHSVNNNGCPFFVCTYNYENILMQAFASPAYELASVEIHQFSDSAFNGIQFLPPSLHLLPLSRKLGICLPLLGASHDYVYKQKPHLRVLSSPNRNWETSCLWNDGMYYLVAITSADALSFIGQCPMRLFVYHKSKQSTCVLLTCGVQFSFQDAITGVYDAPESEHSEDVIARWNAVTSLVYFYCDRLHFVCSSSVGFDFDKVGASCLAALGAESRNMQPGAFITIAKGILTGSQLRLSCYKPSELLLEVRAQLFEVPRVLRSYVSSKQFQEQTGLSLVHDLDYLNRRKRRHLIREVLANLHEETQRTIAFSKCVIEEVMSARVPLIPAGKLDSMTAADIISEWHTRATDSRLHVSDFDHASVKNAACINQLLAAKSQTERGIAKLFLL